MMDIEITHKDASARAGFLLTEAGKFRIPNILHVNGEYLYLGDEKSQIKFKFPDRVFTNPDGYFPVPPSAGGEMPQWKIVDNWLVINNWENLPQFSGMQFDICIFPAGAALFQYPEKFVMAIVSIRKAIGAGKPLYVPGIALPSRIAILAALTIDLLDDALARLLGYRNMLTIPEGVFSAECAMEQNTSALREELALVDKLISTGYLRELIEMRIRAEPELVAMLRYMDFNHYEFMEFLWPVFSNPFLANSKESLWRIDIQRYRARLKSYKKPGASVLLLLPCSAKKPYHKSRSHMLVENALRTTGVRSSVHIVSLTSPIGVVPEELENFYPANAYDIPVTGHWDWEEKKVVLDGLEGIISQGYKHVLAHLPDDYKFVVEHYGLENTCTGDVTSEESLKLLAERVRDFGEEASYSARLASDFMNMLAFQFGEEARAFNLEKAKGNRWDGVMLTEGKPGFEVNEDRGKVMIKYAGAKFLAGHSIKCVEIQKFPLHGDVFVPGIVSATPDIRAGDEVVILQESIPVATGTAKLSGVEMLSLKKGLAIKVREMLV